MLRNLITDNITLCLGGKEMEKALRNFRDEKTELRVLAWEIQMLGTMHYDNKEERKALEELKEHYRKSYLDILQKQREVEEYITSIEDPIVRVCLRLKYIDGCSWTNVGYKTRMPSSTCRSICRRHFLKEKKLKQYSGNNKFNVEF